MTFEVYDGFDVSKDFEAMKAGKLAIPPKSQLLFHKNLPPRALSIMTLDSMHTHKIRVFLLRTAKWILL